MRVKINTKDDNRRVRMSFWVPTGIAGLSCVTNLITNNTSGKLTPQQLRTLVKAIKETRKKFGPMTLVDVESAEGDIVKISI